MKGTKDESGDSKDSALNQLSLEVEGCM